MLESMKDAYSSHMLKLSPLLQNYEAFSEQIDHILKTEAANLRLNDIEDLAKTAKNVLEHLFDLQDSPSKVNENIKEKLSTTGPSILFLTMFISRIIIEFSSVESHNINRTSLQKTLIPMQSWLGQRIDNRTNSEIFKNDTELSEQRRILSECRKKLVERIPESNSLPRKSLAFHINRKNAKHPEKGFHGQLIYHEQSIFWHAVDPDIVFKVLGPYLMQMHENSNPRRTQFFIYPQGQGLHTVVLDVQKQNGSLQCAYIQSVYHASDAGFLLYLKDFLIKNNINHELKPSNSELQNDGINCAVFCLALASIISEIPFSTLRYATVGFPPFERGEKAAMTEYRNVLNTHQLSIFPMHLLGQKAIRLAQSERYMQKLLGDYSFYQNIIMQKGRTDYTNTIPNWKKLYGLELGIDNPNRFTFVELRRMRLEAKEKLGNLLSLESAIEKVKNDPSESITIEQALHRYASGQGPDEGWIIILKTATENNILNTLEPSESASNESYTPLDLAIQHHQKNRSYDLRKSGAKSGSELIHNVNSRQNSMKKQ